MVEKQSIPPDSPQPSNNDPIDIIEKLAWENRDFAKVLTILEQKIGQQPENKAILYYRMGEVYRDHVKNISQAIQCFALAFTFAPNSHEILECLCSLCKEVDIPNYIVYTAKKLHLLEDVPEQAIVLRHELANLYEQQNDMVHAENQWLKILEYEISSAETCQKLQALYQRQERYEDWIKLLQKQAVFHTEIHNTVECYVQIATICQENLHDLERAFIYWEKARILLPEKIDITQAMYQLATKLNDLDKQISCLQNLLTYSQEKIPHLLNLADIYKRQKNNLLAIEYYKRVLDESKDNPDVICILIDLYRLEKQDRELVELLQRKLASATEEEKYHILQELASLTEKMGIWEQAIHYYKSLWDIAKEDWVGKKLEESYYRKDLWEELAKLYEDWLIAIPIETKKDMLLKLGSVYERLENVPKVKATYQEILLWDMDTDIVLKLKQLCKQTKDWQLLLVVLEKELDIATHKVSIYQEIGNIYQHYLPDVERAISSFKKCIELEPKTAEFYHILYQLQEIQGNHLGALETLEAQITITTNGQDVANLLLEEARIYCYQLGNEEKAEKLLQECLKLPGFMPAFAELEAIYVHQARYSDLIHVLQEKNTFTSLEKRNAIHWEIACIYENQLQDIARAQQYLENVLAQDYTEDIAKELYRMYQSQMAWDKVCELCQLCLTKKLAEDAIVFWSLRLANTYQDHLHDNNQAIVIFLQILKVRPNFLPAIKSLQHIYEESENELALADCYLAELSSQETTIQRKIALHLACGQIFANHAQDTGISHYQQVLKYDPDNIRAIRGLENFYRTSENWKELAYTFLMELGIEKDENRLFHIHMELGEIYLKYLDNTNDAIKHLRRAMRYQPQNLSVQRKLEDAFLRLQCWDKYAEYLEERLTIATTDAEKFKYHYDLGYLYEKHLEQSDRACQHLEQAMQLGKLTLDDIHFVEKMYRKITLSIPVDKMLVLYEQELSYDTTTSRTMELYQSIANLSLRKNDHDKAMLYFEKILALDPKNKVVSDQLAQIYLKLEMWPELATLLVRQSYHIDNSKKKEECYIKIATIYEKKLRNLDLAMSYYQKVRLQSANLSAIQGIHRVLEQTKDCYGMIAILSKELEAEPITEQANTYYKIAKLWESKLKKPFQALEAYWHVLQLRFHPEVAEIVINLLKSIKDYDRLVQVLEKVVANIPDGLKKAGYLFDLGNVYVELHQYDKAIIAYQNSYQLVRDVRVLQALESIYSDQNQWTELAKVKENKLILCTSASQSRTIHVELGELYQNKIHDGKAAILHYEHALKLDSQNLIVLRNLQHLYKHWGHFDNYIQMCEKEMAIVLKEDRQLQLLTQIADIFENKLFHAQRAIETWCKILKISDNTNMSAVLALSNLYRQTLDFSNLAKMYLLRISLIGEDKTEEVIPLLLELAMLYRDVLQDSIEAEHVAQKVLSLSPKHSVALDFLDGIYSDSNDWKGLVGILQTKLELAVGPDAKSKECIRIADMYEKLQDWANAEKYYQMAYEITPNISILYALQRIYKDLKNADKHVYTNLLLIPHETADTQAQLYWEICQCLEYSSLEYLKKFLSLRPRHGEAMVQLGNLLLREQKWTETIAFFSDWLDWETDPLEKNQIFYMRSYAYHRLGQEDSRLSDLESSFAYCPDNIDVMVALAEIYYRLENWEKSKKMYERLLFCTNPEKLPERLSLVEIYFYLGMTSEHLHQKEDAILHYQKTLEMDENHWQTLLQLGRIYYNNKLWDDALLLYTKLAKKEDWSEDDRISIHLQLAVIKDKLGMAEGAIVGYMQVLEENSTDIIALEALGNIYLERNDLEQSLLYFQKGVHILPIGCLTQKRLLSQIGNIQEKTQQLASAIITYEVLRDFDPHSREILEKLGNLYIATKQWKEAEVSVWILCQLATTTKEQADTNILLGHINWHGYRNQANALFHYEKSLQIVPIYMPAIQAILDIYQEQQDWQNMALIYRQYLPQIPDLLGEKIPLLFQLAQISMEKLNDEKTAIAVYEQILQNSPDHSGAHVALARLYARHTETHTLAIREYRYLLAQDPLRATAYRELRGIYLQDSQFDRSFVCCQSLQALGNLLPDEETFLRQITPRVASAWLDNDMMQSLLPSGIQGTLYETLALLDPYMEKIYPPYLEEKYNLKKRDKLAEDAGLPICDILHEVCRVLMIDLPDVYIKEGHTISIENTQPLSLVLGSQTVATCSHAQLKFLLGKYLFYASRKHIMANKLTPFEYKSYVDRVVSAFAETGNTDNNDSEGISKKIRNILPRKIRKQLEDRMDIFTELYHSPTEPFQNALEQASNHCGILLAESLLESCYAYLWLKEPENNRKITDTQEMRDFFWFYNSEQHLRLRKEIGIAIKWA